MTVAYWGEIDWQIQPAGLNSQSSFQSYHIAAMPRANEQPQLYPTYERALMQHTRDNGCLLNAVQWKTAVDCMKRSAYIGKWEILLLKGEERWGDWRMEKTA
jgi:hypothetical protein